MNIVVSTGELPPELLQAVEESSGVPAPLGMIGFLLCTAVGILCVRNPDAMWEIRHTWDTVGGEPSDFYRVTTRISGAVLTAVGIAFLILTIASCL